MKKVLCILLAALFVLPFAGCALRENSTQNTVTFYYRRSSAAYGASNSIISSELRDAGDFADDPAALLSQYLQGPESPELSRTFPEGLTLISLRTGGDMANIVLDDSFSALTGMELTVACACLTMTVCELTGTASAHIRTENTVLDENRVIIMNLEDLVLLDESDIVIEPD